MLNRVLPTTSNLVVLDVSGCQLDRIPPSLELCHQSLEELNISRNPLGSLPDWLSNLKSLRVLAADETGCRILPRSLSQLGGLQSLSLRRNRFTHVPVWIHNFSRLERLFVDGNPFEGTWRDILKPLLILPLSAPAADSPRSGQLFSDAHVPLKLQVPPALMPANPMTRQASGSASPGGLSMKAAATTYSDGSPIPSPAPRYGSPSPGIRGANMDPIARRMRSTNDLLLSQLNSSSNTLVSPNGSFASSQMTASPLSEAGPSHLRDELSDPSSQTNSFDSDGHNGTSDENNGGGPKWGGFLKKIGRKASNSRLNSSHGERMRGFESFTMGRENHTKRPSVKSAFSRPGSRPGSAIDPGHNSPAPMSPTNSFKGNSYFPEVGAAPLTPLGPAFVESPAKASSAAVKSNRRKSFLALEQLSLNFKVGPNTALSEPSEECLTQHRRALRGLLQYMKDLDDLSPHGLDVGSGGTTRSLRTIPSRPTLRSLVSLATGESTSEAMSRNSSSTSAGSSNISSIAKPSAGNDASCASSVSGDLPPQASDNDKAANRYSFKDDATRRKRIIEEIVQTEETYVRGLSELVEIYVRPAKNPLEGASGSPVVPLVEQRAVFGNIEGLLQFHVDAFLPCLRSAARPLLQRGSDLCEDEEASLTASVAEDIAAVFTRHSAFFKMYMSYINNCDFAQARIAVWLAPQSVITAAAAFKAGSASLSSSSNLASDCGLTPGQRKKLKSFMKRCRAHPKHHQLNVESYLLLPVQRIPRYRLLLEDLAKCTPPSRLREHDALLTALEHITRIASNVNESKRQSEQDRRLLGWQTRIRGRFPSPLVQPHRRLVRDGPLRLRRVTRRVPAFVKMHPDDMEPSHKFAPAADVNQLVGSSMEQVDCLSQIALDKPLTVLLCNDILVLVNDPSLGRDPSCPVTLHGVEMLKARPCEVYGGGSIRVVTERSVMHFCAVDEEDARSWRDSINAQLAS
ncbi:hypothetical protein IE53DRAFT_258314 [Violaceomyces palustris]|uniref:Uncharacterized protein n=1 Tax=Violaceomyces palustris TaxID=1673888 RepID=A0ACD0P881_9BASI|nr:hypothetical protein IE53DRAFT_258314 [Violaceomyces palustris]